MEGRVEANWVSEAPYYGNEDEEPSRSESQGQYLATIDFPASIAQTTLIKLTQTNRTNRQTLYLSHLNQGQTGRCVCLTKSVMTRVSQSTTET